MDNIKLKCPRCHVITIFPKKNVKVVHYMGKGNHLLYNLEECEYICEGCGINLGLNNYVEED